MAGPFRFTFFSKENIPQWRCPRCLNETLEIIPKSFMEQQTAVTSKIISEDWFEPENYKGVFSCMMTCGRKDCQEVVSMIGESEYEEKWDEQMLDRSYDLVLRAKSFFPSLPLFNIPDACPIEIAEQLKKVSALLPGHASAAVNALRIVLEMLMDEFGVFRIYQMGQKKTKKSYTLNQRIKNYSGPHQEMKEGFLAMKWLGNTGSHSSHPVSEQDIEAACLILDDFLQNIFRPIQDHSETIRRLSQKYDPTFLAKS